MDNIGGKKQSYDAVDENSNSKNSVLIANQPGAFDGK